ncbi:tRNA (guanosine(18)-2'-O)-methyltransferase [Salvia divinorum]|uniref:tRNA (Guanosine(18)-2'-O)-methyltransferase n=1 Tax=Salvia divinorum TaxID=28513 RepID=A0ABD1II28_SALDI
MILCTTKNLVLRKYILLGQLKLH